MVANIPNRYTPRLNKGGSVKYRSGWKYLAFLLALSVFVFSQQASAQITCPLGEDPIAEVISVQGTFTLNTKPLSINDNICSGKIVLFTQANSRAAIRIIATGVKIRLDQNTELRMDASISSESISDISTVDNSEKSFVELITGAIKAFTRKPYKLDVRTPYVTAGVEGTEFLVEAYRDTKEIAVHVFEGHVRMLYQNNNAHSDLDIFANEAGYARENQPPKKVEKVKIKSRNQVDWALYYPPLSGINESEKVNHLLTAGRIDEAKKLLNYSGDNDQKLILDTIVKISEGKSHEVINDPAWMRKLKSTASMSLALSYVYQANLQLKKALETLENSENKDALIWARIAELRLAHGDIKGSADAAQQTPINFDLNSCLSESIKKPPNYIAKTLTVRGFTQLAKMNAHKAILEFQCAIQFASEDPMPRFGLGLAKIRADQLQEGRHDIETAALLDPTNSLIRSYLGKAFFEENRRTPATGSINECAEETGEYNDLADQQFCIAKMLDPNDPTPWFYHAIKKQTENRPVEALKDLQQAIDKNHNRAVYRSGFLLDNDLASRSASLGRIYRDLNFEQLGLLEGWKSVSTDPGDYSGHRLLADIYSTLPRHEVARVNELFQSQLLQPLNVTPIQSQLAEKNLSILNNSGPSEVAFNEFNPLFNQNGLAFQSSIVVGGNNTWGEDISIVGLYDKWSINVGQFHFETDGFHENNDLKQDVTSAFIQYSPDQNTSLIAEVRKSKREQGDLKLLFDPNNFNPALNQSEDINSIKIGFHQKFSPRSKIIGSFVYQDATINTLSLPTFKFDTEMNGHTSELQHHYKGDQWHLTSGFRYSNRDQKEAMALSFSLPVPPFSVQTTNTNKNVIEQTSLYLYSYTNILDNLNLTIGGSIDHLNGRTIDKDLFNPKLGIIWEPLSTTTFRAAVFKTLQGPTFSSQDIQPSLEPTQVAGFNQFFFDDSEGEDSWRYAVALDHEFSQNLYAGIEFSKRTRNKPFIVGGAPERLSSTNWKEYSARAYTYWIPTSNLAVSATYQYDKKDNNNNSLGEFASRIRIHKLPLKLNYSHPSGLSSGLTATYVNEKGIFQDPKMNMNFFADKDSFWVLDAFVSYRLPKRYGLISLSVDNLLDKKFQFQDIDPENVEIKPERMALLKFTLSF